MRENVKSIICVTLFLVFASGCAQVVENLTETPTLTATIVSTSTNTPTPSPEPTTTYVYKPPPSQVPTSVEESTISVEILNEDDYLIIKEEISQDNKFAAQIIEYEVFVNRYGEEFYTDQYELRVINLDNSEITTLETNFNYGHYILYYRMLGWTNDSKNFFYTMVYPTMEWCWEVEKRNGYRIYFYDGEVKNKGEVLNFSAEWVELSPSKSLAAGISPTFLESVKDSWKPKIKIVNFDNFEEKVFDAIEIPGIFHYEQMYVFYGLLWSPDESKLVYAIRKDICDEESDQVTTSLVLIDIISGNQEVLLLDAELDLRPIEWDEYNRIILSDAISGNYYSFSFSSQKLYLLD